ncbi:MAG: hypothetical protein GY694_10730 [Gammaproteobacteria bacterium]|nr:hypothetical protein [Gammaproteobacteria bacterium]
MTNASIAADRSDILKPTNVSQSDSSHKLQECRRSSAFSLSHLLLQIFLISTLLCLALIGLISYFWNFSPDLAQFKGFQQNDLILFISCVFITQMVWHYFALFEWQGEGVVRNQQSLWMFLCPNRLLITSLTVTLSVIVFYWNYLFLPEKLEFIAALFLMIFIPQFFVRIWDVWAKKDTSPLAGIIALSLLVLIIGEEIRYGYGFRYMTAQVEKVAQLESKPGKPQGWDIPIPDSPRWQRDGIVYYPQLFDVLNDIGFQVDQETHLELTPQAEKLLDMGIIPFNHYQGKAFSGLKITDRYDKTIYQYQHPNQFKDFKHVHPFVLKALLVWENDKLRQRVFDKEEEGAELNYLIEGPRIIKSVSEYVQYKVTGEGAYSGGSTLMTTLEKITNTPGGRTQSVTDKLNQMIGAGLHLYGNDSKGSRENDEVKSALVDFLNTVPMAGGPRSHSGELYGFGASYYAWFGHTIDELNEQLESRDSLVRSQVFKNICSLIVSIRRPSDLLRSPDLINRQANLLLSRLNRKKLLNSALFVKSRSLKPAWDPQKNNPNQLDYAMHREASSARNQYAYLMRQAVAKKSGKKEAKKINLQTVDAMSVAIEITTDAQLEANIRSVLDDMYTEVAQQSPFVQGRTKGLLHSLTPEELKKIKYGAVVLEIDKNQKWKILANTDTQSKDVYNPAKQGRFQWGSTAKLRVLVNYLTIVHDEAIKLQQELMYQKLAKVSGLSSMTKNTIHEQRNIFKDYKGSSVTIKRLLAYYIEKHPNASMEMILNWAMSRRISANPEQKFLTGESWHQFHNYQKSDDKKNPNLWQMTTQSINLSFVRLMRDVVDYYIDQSGFDKIAILTDKKNPVRKKILEKAIQIEEDSYQDGLNFFVELIQDSFARDVALNVAESQTESYKKITNFEIISKAREIVKVISHADDESVHNEVFKKYDLKKFKHLASWFKRISFYEKRWLLARVRLQHSTSSSLVSEDEKRIIKQTSQWFRTNKFWKKNTLYTHMERKAFAQGITPAWKKLGYPFTVSPSYAVVLGSSGDTPMSLVELAGTLLNNGLHEKNVSAIDRIVLAPDSEFETRFKRKREQERLIPEAVAVVASKAMQGVLKKGTAVFASRHPLMKYVDSVGAKTGTGDNRHNQVAVNRSAAVLSTFDMGEEQSKYAICITMSVTEGDIERYRFTSKVPVRILARIADHLSPVFTKKSAQELQVELATRRAKKTKQHRLTIASSIKKNRLKFKDHKKDKQDLHITDDSVQLFESLF